jgi:sodium/proline symporter
MIYIVVLAIYLAMMLGLGVFVSRFVKTSDDWAVAGRSLGVFPSACTYFATVISAVSFIGYMGYYYKFGWGGWWNWAGTAISTMIFAVNTDEIEDQVFR